MVSVVFAIAEGRVGSLPGVPPAPRHPAVGVGGVPVPAVAVLMVARRRVMPFRAVAVPAAVVVVRVVLQPLDVWAKRTGRRTGINKATHTHLLFSLFINICFMYPSFNVVIKMTTPPPKKEKLVQDGEQTD